MKKDIETGGNLQRATVILFEGNGNRPPTTANFLRKFSYLIKLVRRGSVFRENVVLISMKQNIILNQRVLCKMKLKSSVSTVPQYFF